jgi:hypothetical protein
MFQAAGIELGRTITRADIVKRVLSVGVAALQIPAGEGAHD